MKAIQEPRILTPQWGYTGKLADWQELPALKQQQALVVLAGMLLNYPRPAEEAKDEDRSQDPI